MDRISIQMNQALDINVAIQISLLEIALHYTRGIGYLRVLGIENPLEVVFNKSVEEFHPDEHSVWTVQPNVKYHFIIPGANIFSIEYNEHKSTVTLEYNKMLGVPHISL